jgi:hypothetical protein
MERRSIHGYIWVGTALRYLADADVNWAVHGPGFVVDNANALRSWLEYVKLPVTLRAYDAVLGPLVETLKATDQGHLLTAAESAQLKEGAKALRQVVDAEAKGTMAYVAIDRRYDVIKLMDDPGSLFAPGVLAKLSPVAQNDIAEAGKCIAFGLPTAAAFQILRATEDTLRQVYFKYVRRNRMKMLLWGPIVSALQARRKRPADVLLQQLNNIRVSFRNPTDHPEKVYDIEEAQDLFALCVDVINRMAKEI